jgi:hypothetical protein
MLHMHTKGGQDGGTGAAQVGPSARGWTTARVHTVCAVHGANASDAPNTHKQPL